MGKATTEGSLELCVGKLRRWGYAERCARNSGAVRWHCNGNETDSINLRGDGGHSIGLSYRWREEPVEQTILLTWTPCRHGGERPWFRCEAYRNGIYCGQRVGKLYGAGRIFACRHCYQLCYASQLESTGRRGINLTHKLRAKLGEDGKKPKGMHWRTYDRLCERAAAVENRSMAGLIMRLGWYMGKIKQSRQ